MPRFDRSEGRRIRVLVVDDHDVVQWGFRLLLTEQPWVERCLTATTAEEALVLARRYEPQVALVDLFLGDASGADLTESIRAASPKTRVLLISGAGRISPHAARAAGASGFVSKDLGAQDVAKAVRAVGLGQSVFPKEVADPPPPACRPASGACSLSWPPAPRTGRSPSGSSSPPHREGAHERPLPQAQGPQPGGGRAARAAPGADRVAPGRGGHPPIGGKRPGPGKCSPGAEYQSA